ncbi:PREDICTED: atherin-like, partial [Cyprinodon variegatus]|uniref:atherin-like n=1 Tax=Cyprinodon variegatus TaxID=28743 RepID=UPI0007429BD3
MPAPRGAAGMSKQGPPAAGHPEITETRPGTNPRRQAATPNATAPPRKNTQAAPPTARAHTHSATNRPRAPRNPPKTPPKTPPRPKARPHPIKTDANSAQRNTPRIELTQEQKSCLAPDRKKSRPHPAQSLPPSSPRAAQSQSGANHATPPPDEARAAQPRRPPAARTSPRHAAEAAPLPRPPDARL